MPPPAFRDRTIEFDAVGLRHPSSRRCSAARADETYASGRRPASPPPIARRQWGRPDERARRKLDCYLLNQSINAVSVVPNGTSHVLGPSHEEG
jgi:hypothetical protein